MINSKLNLLLLVTATFLISCEERITQSAGSNADTTHVIDTTQEFSFRTDINTNSRRDSVITYAERYLGTKYCYAGNDPEKGFDCSGFVNFVYSHFNIELPRSSSGFENLGTALKPKEFKKGDVLVFYGYQDSTSIGHVGIVYEAAGMDSKFIHSSSGKDYGVIISELNSDMYTRRFYKCINVLELENAKNNPD